MPLSTPRSADELARFLISHGLHEDIGELGVMHKIRAVFPDANVEGAVQGAVRWNIDRERARNKTAELVDTQNA